MQGTLRNLVVSPHLDDAFFSLGGMLSNDAPYRQVVVDVFTVTRHAPRGHSPQWGCAKGDVECITRLRKEEELRNCKSVRAEVEFLDFLDAPLRGRKIFHSSPLDEKQLSDSIKERIRAPVREAQRTFFPLAVGRHIDHAIVSRIGLELTVEEGTLARTYFYEDLPYSAEKKVYPLIDPAAGGSKVRSSLISFPVLKKWRLCSNYRSQFSNRAYRKMLRYAKGIKLFGTFYERVWQIADPGYVAEILACGDGARPG